METPTTSNQDSLPIGDDGYHKDLHRRQLQMIGIGGAIGTGLFLGAGARLSQVGPSLALVYCVCGFFSFLILRALGELVVYRPSAGSFVSYAREFFGEWAAYAAGWMSFLNWCMTGIVDITAVALYMRFWSACDVIPQWAFALIALSIVGGMNLISVKYFGELEFWLSAIKVAALSAFLLIGVVVLGFRIPVAGEIPGFHIITQNGGLFPHGIVPTFLLIQGVLFAYASMELIGTAAGECSNPRRVIPSAINNVIWRIALFYVGSILLLVCVLPWQAYHAGVSPFVTFFQALGLRGADNIMNVVVLTAALSSLNSGLYSTGRTLRSLAAGGSAPHPLTKMNRHSVPYVAILTTVCVYLIGVGLNYIIPAEVFEVVLNMAALGVISTWACILLCQMRLRSLISCGKIARVPFRMPGAPLTAWLSLAFLMLVIVMMAFDYPEGTMTVGFIPIFFAALFFGWKMIKLKRRIDSDQARKSSP